MDDSGNEIIAVCNFVPVERRDYKIGVPFKGRYKLVFNSDAVEFGGSGITEKSFKSEHYAMHGFEESISMTLAPLSVIYLKYAPVKKRTPKAAPEETKAVGNETNEKPDAETEKPVVKKRTIKKAK
jgi:1,4-alpha-glucan branching enzyme